MTNVDQPAGADWPHLPPSEPPLKGYGLPPGAPLPPPQLPAAPPPPAGRPRGKGPLVAVAVVAAMLILGGAFVAGTKISQSNEAATPPSTSTTAPASKTAPSTSTPPSSRGPSSTTTPPSPPSGGSKVDEQAVKAEVAELSKYVEKQRGLTFKNPVEVTVLGESDFKARVLREFESETDKLREQGQLYQALGLIPADADPVDVQKKLLGDGVLGFYDPKTKQLVVRGENIGPFFREITVHELTHALDDQHFGLDRPDLDNATDGSDFAFSALVEGNARRIEFDYVRQMSDADKQELISEQMALGQSQLSSAFDTPITLAQLLTAPYDYGEPFVRGLLQRQGQGALDQAFGKPPTTSEQILQGDKFDRGEGAKSVPAPTADGEKLAEGTLGELMTGFVVRGETNINDLLDKVLNGELDPNEILGQLGGLGGGDPSSIDDPTKLISGDLGGLLPKADTVKNWGGDHYVLYRNAGQMCVKVDWVMDGPSDLASLKSQLDKRATKDTAMKITAPSADSLRMTRCVQAPSSASGGGNGA